MMKPPTHTHTILIVDDAPANLQLLVQLLNSRGYKTRPVPNGARALDLAYKISPDLILLDIMMPEMTGYEVCAQLKADERTRDIPIIFLSALDELDDKMKAFEVGGVDYITKPFREIEVLARVETHLALRQAQQNLLKQNRELETFAKMVLAQNNELDAFARTVAHDLKNPLSTIATYVQMWRTYAPTLSVAETELIGQQIAEATQLAVNIVEELLFLASVRKEEVHVEPLDMGDIVRHAQYRLTNLITEYQGEIIMPTSWPIALGYMPWVMEIWVNYLSNGLKYGGQPPRLTVGATPLPQGQVQFWVQDNGLGLTPEAQAKLFTEFTRLDRTRATGHGLGLTIVQRIATKLRGEVGVKSMVGQGSLFYFTLPSA